MSGETSHIHGAPKPQAGQLARAGWMEGCAILMGNATEPTHAVPLC